MGTLLEAVNEELFLLTIAFAHLLGNFTSAFLHLAQASYSLCYLPFLKNSLICNTFLQFSPTNPFSTKSLAHRFFRPPQLRNSKFRQSPPYRRAWEQRVACGKASYSCHYKPLRLHVQSSPHTAWPYIAEQWRNGSGCGSQSSKFWGIQINPGPISYSKARTTKNYTRLPDVR